MRWGLGTFQILHPVQTSISTSQTVKRPKEYTMSNIAKCQELERVYHDLKMYYSSIVSWRKNLPRRDWALCQQGSMVLRYTDRALYLCVDTLYGGDFGLPRLSTPTLNRLDVALTRVDSGLILIGLHQTKLSGRVLGP